IQADAGVWIEQQSQAAWDIIFLDPPFAGDELAVVLPIVSNRRLLKNDGLVYIETPRELSRHDLPIAWEILRSKQASNVHYCLCRQADHKPTRDSG
ncbi:MAG: RsmD family RNA methyltransferase, partial [bacterium]